MGPGYRGNFGELFQGTSTESSNHGDQLLYGHSQCLMSRMDIHDHHHSRDPVVGNRDDQPGKWSGKFFCVNILCISPAVTCIDLFILLRFYVWWSFSGISIRNGTVAIRQFFMLEIKDCDICYMYIHDCKCGISTDISFLLFTSCIILRYYSSVCYLWTKIVAEPGCFLSARHWRKIINLSTLFFIQMDHWLTVAVRGYGN